MITNERALSAKELEVQYACFVDCAALGHPSYPVSMFQKTHGRLPWVNKDQPEDEASEYWTWVHSCIQRRVAPFVLGE